MVIGFVIWTLICLILLGIGIWAWNAKEPVGFFAGVKVAGVKDIKGYNHAVAILWFVYAVLLEAVGIPFLFLEQNSAGFVPVILGTVVLSIALPIAYTRIEKKYRA
ncbi:MAG: hypothetical protein K5686_10230 [Lachnospiraceae bacterium]|nr:hypothetical protein [Lachnospiraceae bacterium]